MWILSILLAIIIPKDIPEGSIVLLTNNSRAVSSYTKSSLTHAAIILEDRGELYVYEATYPVVRKISFSEYKKEYQNINPLLPIKSRQFVEMYVVPPKKPYTKEQIEKMKNYAENQLGKNYSLFGYFQEEDKKEKTHCSEYVTNILLHSDDYSIKDFGVNNPNKVSPKILSVTMVKTYKIK